MAKPNLKATNVLTLLLLVMVSLNLQAAYTFSVIPQTAFDNTTTNVVWSNTNTGFPNDDDHQLVPIGFNFSFGGVNYTQTRIISNGMLHFGADQAVHQAFANTTLPTGAGDRLVMPYWDDLDPSSGGTVTYGTFGTAPNRRFAATWNGVPRYNQPFTNYTLQVVLFESGNILYRYGSGNANGASATIGIEEDGADFTQFSFNTVSVSNAQDILWTPEVSAITRIDSHCLSTTQISIIFDGPVTSGVVDDITNYSINNGITINTATIVNPTTVQLTTSAFTLGTTYTLQSVNPAQNVNFIFGAATFADLFDVTAYSNNDGSINWTGTWIENQEQGGGGGPLAGNITITGGELRMDDRPNTNGEPNLYREVDLSGFTSATLTFDYRTPGNLENPDRFDIDISGNGGASYTTVQTFSNDATGTLNVDLTPFLASNTRIRFLVENNYGGPGEAMFIDNVQIVAIPDASACLAAVDHYSITHSGQGVTCEAEPITITAHDASDVAVSPSSSTTITLSTSIFNDGWALNSGNGTFTSPNQYTFDGTETSVVFWLTKTTVATGMDIDVTDGTATDQDGDIVEDIDIDFLDTGFRFYADNAVSDIGVQIAGKESDIAPGSQTLEIRAVETNLNTRACEARIPAGQHTIQMGFECIDPTTCKTNNGVTISDINGGAGGTLADNPQGAPIADFNNVELTFNNNGEATWTMNYQDVGEIRLHASYLLPASGADPAFTLTGSSNSFTTVPAGLCVSSPDANAACLTGDENCTRFVSAGSPFNLDIRAVAWETAGETNGDFCSGNSTTPNFQLNAINIDQNLVAPSPGAVGAAGVTLFNMVDADNGDHNINDQTTSEVGVFSYTANPPLYLGQTIASSISDDIGRFTPASFSVVVTTAGELEKVCKTAALPTEFFTYIGQDFGYDVVPEFRVTAHNALVSTDTTQNYRDGFVKLNAGSITITDILQDNTQVGTDLVPLDISYTPAPLTFTANNDGTVDYVFGADVYRYGEDSTVLAHIKFANSEVAPFDSDFDLEITQVNDGEVSTMLSQLFNIADTRLLFGRIRMSNVHGSELLDLQMPMIVEYFNGTAYQINFEDNGCTFFDNADLVVLNDSLVTPGASTISVTNSPTNFGDLGVTLTSPGTDNVGQIDLRGQLVPGILDHKWLRYDWNADGVFDNDPEATATFGIFKGQDVNIYIQQVYQ